MTRGSRFVNIDELKQIGTPEPTKSYQPLSHFDLTGSLKTISQDILKDYVLVNERYEVAQGDAQLFGVLDFSTGESEMNLSIGFRNSLNKSLSVGICIGSSVIVCSNLMFSAIGGGITVLKKHSKGLLNGLEDMTITTLYRSQFTFNQLIKDASLMKAITLNDSQAYSCLGRLYGFGVLAPRQLTTAYEQWNNPTHEEFRPRTLYSLYQAVTEALKTTPVANSLETYINAHQMLLEVV